MHASIDWTNLNLSKLLSLRGSCMQELRKKNYPTCSQFSNWRCQIPTAYFKFIWLNFLQAHTAYTNILRRAVNQRAGHVRVPPLLRASVLNFRIVNPL